jgi:hypothetical protein
MSNIKIINFNLNLNLKYLYYLIFQFFNFSIFQKIIGNLYKLVYIFFFFFQIMKYEEFNISKIDLKINLFFFTL